MATRVDSREEQFERLYEQYVGDVYRYALAVLRNPADAEDVTQTTFLNAYRAFKGGEEPLKPQNWLITIAHNACRTRAIRASRRPREVPLDDRIGELALPERDAPNVEAILAALGKLPFNQRSALVMRELEGRTYEEIAATLDVSVSAVETLIFRARRSLRLKRDALRGLAAVPVPASLHSFGGGAAASGGSAIAGGAVAKIAVVAAALLAGGAGYHAAGGDAGAATAKPRAATARVVEAVAFTPLAPEHRRTVAIVRHVRVSKAARATRRRNTTTAEIKTLPVAKRPLEPGSGGSGGHPEPAPAPAAAADGGGTSATGGRPITTTTAEAVDVVTKVVPAVDVVKKVVPAVDVVKKVVPAVQVAEPAVPQPPAVAIPSVSVTTPPVEVPAAPAVPSVPAPAPAPPITLP